jgi:flavorubredoxin
MEAVKIKENIYWVGAIDYDVRIFHGYETPQGTTYNAYLILDEQVTLIDTVKAPFTNEMIKRIESVIPLDKIDNLISNHVEPDHSGALSELALRCLNAKIYTSPNGQKGLKAYYRALQGRPMEVVKTGDSISTGSYSLQFVLMPMVHWPDSMATYLVEEKVLFSNDAFGQHLACPERYDDEIGLERLLERAGDYYANIVLPFGIQVNKLIGDISGLTFEMICPSHGVILRQYIAEVAEKYAFWAGDGVQEDKAVIAYDTMWGATRLMAEKIAAELKEEGIKAELLNLGRMHVSEAMKHTLEAKYIFIGSSTLNRGVMHTVAAFLSYLKGLNPKKRIGMAFGAYGWSGESVGIIEEALTSMGYEMRPARKAQWWVEEE